MVRGEVGLNENVKRKRIANRTRADRDHGGKMTGNDGWRDWGSERSKRRCTERAAGRRIGADDVACPRRVFIM